MEKSKRIAAVILAAGYSSRMKDFKPLMLIGAHNPLEIQIRNLKRSGIEDIYVVIGFNADSMRKFLEDKNVHVVYNENFDQGMFTSVQTGLQAGLASDNNYSGFLLMLVDSPLIPPYVIKTVMKHHYINPDWFVVPMYQGEKGHPIVIPNHFVDEILTYEGDGGLKAVRDLHNDMLDCVDMHCQGIVMDMDTPQGYQDLIAYYEATRYPTAEKCERLLEMAGTPAHVKRHCRMVAEIALRIGHALVKKGYPLNLDLIRAAGLLHDILRIEKRHWEAGALLVEDYGYDDVAEIVRIHMSYIHPTPIREIKEKDVVCLADKLCYEDTFCSLESRMDPIRKRWENNPEALAIMERRIDGAMKTQDFIELAIGRSIEELIKEEEPDKARIALGNGTRKLYLIRHGETQKHREKIFLGQTDVPLDPEGQEQCTRAGMELKKHAIQTQKIYTSDLKRAKESAKIISKILDFKPEIIEVPEFSEMSLGAWDGMFIREVMELYPEEYELRGKTMLSHKISDDAETFYELRDRVLKKFNEIAQSSDEDIIIVAHAGVNRVIMCELQGKELMEMFKINFPRGSIEIIDI